MPAGHSPMLAIRSSTVAAHNFTEVGYSLDSGPIAGQLGVIDLV